MQIDLTAIEAQLVLRHLERHIAHLDTELVLSDKPELQHTLEREIEALRAVCDRLREDPQQTLPDIA
jgi:hypothetical protein